jgi:peptidoglycan hydrolase-like protein with peptidoglycan-binding domain
MPRLLFAKGAKGDIIRRVQQQLSALGLYTKTIDADYGGGTVTAIKGFQVSKGLPQTGEIDDVTWEKLMDAPIPSVEDRCLGLTAAFEGHGFTLAQGNFDQAGVTWGIIGFTLIGGELKTIFTEACSEDENGVRACFGDDLDVLRAVFDKSKDEQLAWADSISEGQSKAKLKEPWVSAFAKFGESELGQRLQLERVNNRYQKKAGDIVAKYGLTTELGRSLAFDIAVQNGSVNDAAAAQIEAQMKPDMTQQQKREVIATAVGENAKNVAFRQDVLTRKLTIARGEGVVHGTSYVLRNWGLADL